MSETYAYVPRPPLPVPVTVLNGRDDAMVDPERVAGWAELSTGPVEFEEFPGDHFYLRDGADAVLGVLSARLRHAPSA
ncbi:thioesterase domain-containing protein [Streptomyces sp. M19]